MLFKLIDKAAARAPQILDRFFNRSSDPLLAGRLEEHAEKAFPKGRYPTMWTQIPDDIRRPIVWDGRLLNGAPVHELAQRHMTPEILTEIVRKSGRRALLLTALLIGFMLLTTYVIGGASIAMLTHGLSPEAARMIEQGMRPGGASIYFTPYPYWSDGHAWGPALQWYLLAGIERAFAFVGPWLNIAFVAAMLFPALWFFAAVAGFARWWSQISHPLQFPSRDSLLMWKDRTATRPLEYDVYCRQVANATGRLSHQPLIHVGTATGLLRSRGDMEAPTKGQPVAWDGESLRQHSISFGGTGEGKTRLFIRPVFKAIMSAAWGEGHRMGAFVIDGKGTLHRSLSDVVSGRDDVVTLGTGAGEYGVDLTKGMSPLEIATTFKAVSGQVAGKPSDDFWPESASLLLMHAATLAAVLELDDETVAEWNSARSCRPYSLIGIALIASDEGVCRAAFDAVHAIAERLDTDDISEEDREAVEQALASITWLDGSFLPMATETRSSIIANVNVVLGKLSGSPQLARRFCAGTYSQTVDVDHALKGGIQFVAIGETEHGTAGKVVSCWLKTRLYVLARKRLTDDPDACASTSCALIADEFQMLATIGQDSDSTFWNIARETGVFLIAATQSLAALKQVMGSDATDNLINLLRSKIILKTEELSTLEYARRLAGETPRGWEVEDHYFSTQGQREIAMPDVGTADLTLGWWAGIPRWTRFKTSTFSIYNLPREFGMKKGTEGLVQGQDFRMEDRNRAALVEGLQWRPKIELDELLLGNGLAFAVIQRAGGDRMDLIDLEAVA